MRHGVIGIARELERRLPDLVTTRWWKEERGEKVFVDFNQACRDRTIASAYQPRPLRVRPCRRRSGWDELGAVDPRSSPCARCRSSSPARGRVGRDRRRDRRRLHGHRPVGQGRQRARPGRAELPAGLPEDAGGAAARAAQQAAQGQVRRGVHGAQGRARRGAPHDWGCRSSRQCRRCWPSRSRTSGRKGDVLYEPKWDGFRSIIFRSGDQSRSAARNEKPMTRYFPEVVEAVLGQLPRAVRDRRRDRPRVTVVGRPARLRGCSSSASTPPPVAGQEAGGRDPGRVRRLRPARPRRRGLHWTGRSPSGAPLSRRRWPRPRRRST